MNKIILGFFACFLFSCEKGHIQEHNEEPPTISSNHPIRNKSYKPGDTIFIKANISDNIELHEISVQIKDLSDNKILFRQDEHIHVKNRSIDTFLITSNVPSSTYYKLEIIANNHADKKTFHEKFVEVIP